MAASCLLRSFRLRPLGSHSGTDLASQFALVAARADGFGDVTSRAAHAILFAC